MIYVGDKKAKKCFLGDVPIGKVYLGDELLFKSADSYLVSVNIDPAGSGTVSGAGRYLDGDIATLAATPAKGNMFVGWEASIEEGAFGNLPEGYRELEYIQSDGACGIDTGYGVNFAKTRVVIDIEMGDYTSGNEYIFRSDVSSSKYFYLYRKASGSVIFRANTFSAQTITVNNPNSRMTFDFDGPNLKFAVGDTEKTYTSAQLPDTTMGTSFHLFSSVTTTTTTKSVSAKLYSVKIYTGDKLNRDFVPCKNPDGVIGLFDLVNGRFYENAWGGTFTAGPEKNRVFVNESSLSFTPTSNVSFVAKFKQILPDGYTLLEYISNPNSSYMLLPFAANSFSAYRFEVKIRRDGDSTGQLVGAYSMYTSTSASGTITARMWSFGISDTGSSAGKFSFTDYLTSPGELLDIIYDGPSKTCSVNGSDPGAITTTNTLYQAAKPALFALVNRKYGATTGTSYSNILKCDFYHMKIYVSGILKYEYYPCVNPDGEVGIYDVVGSGFLQNVNASKLFVAGPAV